MYLDPIDEYKNLSNWITPLINRSIKPRLFARRLYRFLNKWHPIRLRLITEVENLEPNDFSIGAEYDPDLDQQHKKQIIINLFINHPKNTPWKITNDTADRFAVEMVEALVHEYQHQHQYRSRRYRLHREHYVSEHSDPEIKNEQEYLGNPDEIDAYATNIAARIWVMNYGLNTNVFDAVSVCDSFDLRNYFKTFGTEHKIVTELLEKIRTNLQQLKDIDDGKIRRKTSRRPRLRRGAR
jgi:hypothetical protein